MPFLVKEWHFFCPLGLLNLPNLQIKMLLRIHPENPELRKIRIVTDCLRNGGVIIYPSDTVYALGCDIHQPKAIERIYKIKNKSPKKANFSFICFDFSHLSDFVFSIDTPIYRVMRKALPGPFTFILKANSKVPKIFQSKKKTVGIRIPDYKICNELVKELGNPIITTSIHDEDEILDYTTDPHLIYEKYEKLVDIVIDGGFGGNMPSTVVDCSEGDFTILRQGLGNLDKYL
jgi:tRNA threonylcarbamoyl adenosine modification protein (Sua5/YciO/YrdC/YwlC family)